MNAPPAFQFYAADYLADEHVQLMTLEEEGIYIRLLAYCWREGSIPADPVLLSRLCKGGSTEAVTMVLTRFEPHPTLSSRMVHSRLEGERLKQEQWRAKSAEGGRKSAASRTKSAEETDEPPLNHPSSGGSTLQSSSSPSTSKQKHSAKAGADAPPERARPPDTIWGMGVQMLITAGMNEQNARTFLGNLNKQHGKEKLAQAISTTSSQNPVNPSEYLVKVLQKPTEGKNGRSNTRTDTIRSYDYSAIDGEAEGEDARLNYRKVPSG